MAIRHTGPKWLATAIAGCALLSTGAARADWPPTTSPALQHLEPGQHFSIDPVADGVLIAGGAGFSSLLSLVLGSGEIRAAAPGPESNLLSIDRGAIGNFDKNASTYADIGLYTAVAFAVLDPFLSAARDGWDAGVVDAVLYGETVAITETLTDITKIAVRRPRPIDYVNCPYSATPTAQQTAGCSDTNFALSFFSGHASTVASIGATATYLAFERSPRTARPWVTLAASVLLTTFVSYERVRGGDHFPTDVVAGAMAGAAVGVIVPHLHRHQDEAPPILVGAAPTPGGVALALTGSF